jgi:hypothetical protein
MCKQAKRKTYEGREEEEGQEEEHLAAGVEGGGYGVPGERRHAWRGEEEEEDRAQHGRQRVGAEKPLVERDEEHQVVRGADGEDGHGGLVPAHPGRRPGRDEVADDGDVAGRVGHHGQELPAAREPLPVDLHVQRQDGQREGPPQHVVGRRAGPQEEEGRGLQEQQARDPRREQVVHGDVVPELCAHGGEAEQAARGVERGERQEGEQRQRPEEKEGHGGQGAQQQGQGQGRLRGRRSRGGVAADERAPQQRLPAERQADAEVAGVETRQHVPPPVAAAVPVRGTFAAAVVGFKGGRRCGFQCHLTDLVALSAALSLSLYLSTTAGGCIGIVFIGGRRSTGS